MLRALLCFCLLGLALADGYNAPKPVCTPGQEALTVTNTHVNTVVDTVTVHNYLTKDQVVDVTSVVVVPSPLTAGHTFTPLPTLGVPTTTKRFTNTVLLTTHHTVKATAAVITTTRLVATEIQVVGTVTLTMTGLVSQPVTETYTAHDLVTALSTVTITTEAHTATIETEERYNTLTATSQQVVLVPATSTVTSTITSVVEATVSLTQHDRVTLCYSPEITYQH